MHFESEPIRSFQRVVCYRVVAVRGEGVEGDPVRETVSWFTEDGELIAYNDHWSDARADPPLTYWQVAK